MKPIILILILPLLFTACSPAALTEMPASEASPAADTPIPTQEPTPTVPPLPLPCTLAFDSDRDGNREIYIMDPDGGNLVNLTNNPADDFAPSWSPDGSRIAFVSTRPTEQGSVQTIYVMNADGSNLIQLTTNIYNDWPDWSHDGSMITYAGNEDIFVTKADGSGQPVNLTNSPERDNWPSWSPDDSQLVWSSGSDGNWNNFVMNADGSHVLQITDNGRVAVAKWTVDGRIFTGWGWANQEPFCQNCLVDADGTDIAEAGGKAELQRYFPFWTLAGDRVEVALGGDEIQLVGEIYPGLFLNLTNNPAQDLNPDWPSRCGQ